MILAQSNLCLDLLEFAVEEILLLFSSVGLLIRIDNLHKNNGGLVFSDRVWERGKERETRREGERERE
jgi:hypothetical protein